MTTKLKRGIVYLMLVLAGVNRHLVCTQIYNLWRIGMNKGELIEAVASATGATKADAGRAIDATVDSITGALKKGDTVTLIGFGTFKTAKRAARTGRNPQTGAALQIPARTVPSFKAGAALKSAVN